MKSARMYYSSDGICCWYYWVPFCLLCTDLTVIAAIQSQLFVAISWIMRFLGDFIEKRYSKIVMFAFGFFFPSLNSVVVFDKTCSFLKGALHTCMYTECSFPCIVCSWFKNCSQKFCTSTKKVNCTKLILAVHFNIKYCAILKKN